MNTTETMVKMVLDRWNALLKNFDTDLNAMSDEQLMEEIAPEKNRGIYLLGHLIAVHDDMITLLDFGDKLYPEINAAFKAPDKSIVEIPSAATLRTYWKEQNEVLTSKTNSLPTDAWFQKHTAVSDEDFQKEPHRNKLNIMLTRATHLAYHHGQFVLLK